ncbi:GNAT family N-acetyltransferase [Bacillus sp. NPDC077027]|uniref:GNAT family N-acetyltransferase n=1 Tax=Bacillus sp. NPDC077027 TaxID=3390548 RepID=UPI003CFE231B
MVELKDMSQSDYDKYTEHAINDYAKGKVTAGTWTEEEAPEQAAKQFQKLLPEGRQSVNHELWNLILDGDENIGWLWLYHDPHHPQKEGFIYGFILFEAYRGKGYAKQALHALDEKAKTMGLEKLSLHVFGHNHIARSLYEKTGYEETSIMMSKIL